MKFKTMATIGLAATMVACSAPKGEIVDQSGDADYIGKHELTIADGRMTPEVLWALGRLSDVRVSPDNSKILYGVSYYSVEQNKSNRELFVMNADGTNRQQITHTKRGEYAARWVKNGGK